MSKITPNNKISEEALDNTIDALKFQPTKDMVQDCNGAYRWKAGTVDQFGKKIGGNFVKGSPSPNPDGRSGKEKEVLAYFRDISMDAAETLYTIMMDPNESSKIRATTANMILDRGLGKPKQQTEHIVPKNFDELIRPIIIKQS